VSDGRPEPGAFAFHRGSLALDFVGTLGARRSDRPVERLPEPADLGRWLTQAGLVEPEARLPSQADYRQALALREAIARVGIALAEDRAPAAADIEVINAAASDTADGVPYLDPQELTERWRTEHPVRLALARVAVDAVHVFSHQREQLTRCSLPDCGALLLSRARNEPRRWCSMDTCGNRAKVAAFRARRSSSARRSR
jgi:predicted RNA-binding Zn ribbon-like protein